MAEELKSRDFHEWLQRYGAAWETRDPKAAASLFSEDAEYFWTPFQQPKKGRTEITEAWRDATERQREVRFQFKILAIAEGVGLAWWHTSLIRVASGNEIELDGILMAEFDNAGLCRTFREWWHTNEG